ncbi:protein-L-isoaspartate(D-aspartate) O-methyltransferase [Alienimonas chondri]|uniref:Protein-L-isoaspartate O-methyltransferase n=1 Tax=Alienimonas chondri TaxID=2681879 RepID=A0ABX1VH79_9PLAN|nr:protein-L-isoaspartate(D-aspartate) O-methyltransferase [Alienimonas chondri]NNJ26131.1 Protein-L-isoaspartate O-methyltransferase [Alienimonas chondri]
MPDPHPAAAFAESLRGRGIADERVIAAVAAVDRARFMPPGQRSAAWIDAARPIGSGQTISQPSLVARMTGALELTGDETVLEIGTGSGYQAAILARLCARVVTVERLPELADPARETLGELGVENVTFRTGDGTLGAPEEAPFDAIVVTAAAPDVPPALRDQLADGGRLVIPVGDRFTQELIRVRKTGKEFDRETLCGCRFVPLIGEQGWSS